ncbi:MAG: hypothetical protein ACREOZ_02370, partial [Gloeomargaritales cyanobacterium]
EQIQHDKILASIRMLGAWECNLNFGEGDDNTVVDLCDFMFASADNPWDAPGVTKHFPSNARYKFPDKYKGREYRDSLRRDLFLAADQNGFSLCTAAGKQSRSKTHSLLMEGQLLVIIISRHRAPRYMFPPLFLMAPKRKAND